MPGAYKYPPDLSLLREKLSYLPKTDTGEAWKNFERYWQAQKPVQQKVKRQFTFVGIPYTLLLRACIALCLIGLSLLLYNTVNTSLPRVLNSPEAAGSKSAVKKSLQPTQKKSQGENTAAAAERHSPEEKPL